MVASVQEQVDGLQAKGLPALQQMQRVDPKMLVGIAIDNLEQDLKTISVPSRWAVVTLALL